MADHTIYEPDKILELPMIYRFSLLFVLLLTSRPLCSQEYNITHFGAVGNGERINTGAIQDAIDACHETGGDVVVPGGVFITGTIRLKSHVNLKLDYGAVIKGSPDPDDYPVHSSSCSSGQEGISLRTLILAEGKDSIRIYGAGTIDGNGAVTAFNQDRDTVTVSLSVIRFIDCHHVNMEDVRLVNSPMWMQQYVACGDVRISGIEVHNHGNRNNTGLNIIGCHEVIVNDCDISAEEDGISLETLPGFTDENISISDCMVRSNCNAVRISGGIKGDHRYISIKNCVIAKTGVFSDIWKRDTGSVGFVIETLNGGTVEQVMVSDVVVTGVNTPLLIMSGNTGGQENGPGAGQHHGVLRYITVTNFNGQSGHSPGCSITGMPGHPLENIELNNVTVHAPGGGPSMESPEVTEQDDVYSRAVMSVNNLPAHGIFFSHIKGMKVRGADVFIKDPDHRPAVYLDDVDNAEIHLLRVKAFPGIDALIKLVDARNITISGTVVHPDAPVFVKVAGKKSANILLRENIIMKDTKSYELAGGLSTNIIRVK